MAECGKKIKQFRKLRGLTVTQLASLAELSRDTIYRVERGERGLTVNSLTLIANALDIPLVMLVE